MPRDINGTYTLPAGNPVISHETIESNWANTTLPDIQAALTDSLSRSGNGGMLVPFRFIDGSISAPGMTFANEPTSGIYRAGLNDVRVSIGTQDVLKFTLAGVTIPAGKTLSGSITGTITGGSITGGSINNTPIGNVTPSTGAFTSVVTPLVKSPAGAHLNLGTTDLGTLWSIQTSNGDLLPTLDNALSFGGAGNRVKTGTFGTSVVTPVVSNPAGGLTLSNLQINAGGHLVDLGGDNLHDIGIFGDRFRTGNFGTSVVTPFITAAAGQQVAVRSPVNGGLVLGAHGTDYWQLYDGVHAGLLYPLADNVYDIGTPTNRPRTYNGVNMILNGATGSAPGTKLMVGSAATKSVTTRDQQLWAVQSNDAAGELRIFVDLACNANPALRYVGFGVHENGVVQRPLCLNPDGALVYIGGNPAVPGINLNGQLGVIDSGKAGPLSLGTNNGTVGLVIADQVAAVNYMRIRPEASGIDPSFIATGGDVNVGFRWITLGTGGYAFNTGGSGANTQFKILPSAGAANCITVAGAVAGGNPTIGTTGGSVNFSAPVIFSAGSSGFPVPSFTSAELVATNNTLTTVPHGLGRLPRLIRAVLRCKIAELGYAFGEEVDVPYFFAPGIAAFNIGVSADVTNLYAVIPQGFNVAAKSTKTQNNLTNANWVMVMYAW